jgi:hypothetical protein
VIAEPKPEGLLIHAPRKGEAATPSDEGALERPTSEWDDETIEPLAEGIAMGLREKLQAMVADLGARKAPSRFMTVPEVAEWFGVARSTVYAHWREWGGEKLGPGRNAPIRFRRENRPH